MALSNRPENKLAQFLVLDETDFTKIKKDVSETIDARMKEASALQELFDKVIKSDEEIKKCVLIKKQLISLNEQKTNTSLIQQKIICGLGFLLSQEAKKLKEINVSFNQFNKDYSKSNYLQALNTLTNDIKVVQDNFKDVFEFYLEKKEEMVKNSVAPKEQPSKTATLKV